MSANVLSLVSNNVALNATQQGLLNYVQTWGVLSLSSARWEPLSTKNLPVSMQQGIARGFVESKGTEFTAASGYVGRAQTCERVLLKSLGLDDVAVESFVDLRLPFGDYFEEPLYPWQEDRRLAEQVVAEMSRLHDAVGRAALRIEDWKRTRTSFKHVKEHLSLADGLLHPLESLRDILVANVAKARFSLKDYGPTEEGLLTYFGIKTPRRSGAYAFYLGEDEVAALETIIPPAAG